MTSPEKDEASNTCGFYPFKLPEHPHEPLPGSRFVVNSMMETLVQGELPPVATSVRDVARCDAEPLVQCDLPPVLISVGDAPTSDGEEIDESDAFPD
jgi:hypothetical protein